MNKPLVCITGPTAAGKSAGVLALAERWPIEVINVDSATIYTGMDIGTAKPDAQERSHIKHHLLDIRDPAQSYSVGSFCDDCTGLINQIRERGNIPILVGGTMMYYNALRKGLNELPTANASIRQELDNFVATQGIEALHAQLKLIDPDTAARLASTDSQRIQRAMEIYKISGKTMSELTQEEAIPALTEPLYCISLEPSNRLALHQRIEQRFDQMLEKGLVKEVQSLYQRDDLHIDLPSIRCVGYRQYWEYLDGDGSLEQAREKGIAATRQLAKRQLTWLRAWENKTTIDCLEHNVPEQLVDIFAAI